MRAPNFWTFEMLTSWFLLLLMKTLEDIEIDFNMVAFINEFTTLEDLTDLSENIIVEIMESM